MRRSLEEIICFRRADSNQVFYQHVIGQRKKYHKETHQKKLGKSIRLTRLAEDRSNRKVCKTGLLSGPDHHVSWVGHILGFDPQEILCLISPVDFRNPSEKLQSSRLRSGTLMLMNIYTACPQVVATRAFFLVSS